MLFKPTENGSIYANYAISQQPPGGSSLELSSSANNANNPIFDPQKAETAEIGTKWNLLDDNLLLTAALYDTTVSNEIVQDPVDQQYYQSGEKRVRGVELSAVGRITDALVGVRRLHHHGHRSGQWAERGQRRQQRAGLHAGQGVHRLDDLRIRRSA